MQYTSSTTLERQAGSSQHAAFVGSGMILHALMLIASAGVATTGPLVQLFSNLTMIMLETPSTKHFTLMAVQLTDKVCCQISFSSSSTE